VYWETSADGVTYVPQGFTAAANIAFSLDVLNVQFNVKAFGPGAATASRYAAQLHCVEFERLQRHERTQGLPPRLRSA
jgi:hypothetical protein